MSNGERPSNTTKSEASSVDYSALLADAQKDIASYPAQDRAVHTGHQLETHEQILEAEANWRAGLDELQARLPEVAEKREAIEYAGREITEKYGIRSDFFDSPDRNTVFAAIASRWAESGHQKDNKAERDYLHDCLVLLADKHSDQLALEHAADSSHDSSPDSQAEMYAYDKYTDRQLSAAITEAIKEGRLLGEVRERLGVTAENEDPYEVRVLSIAPNGQTIGLDGPAYPLDMPEDPVERRRLMQENYQDNVDVRAWRSGLEKRSKDFAGLLGRENVFASAWVTEIDGKKMLCIPSSLAEILLDPTLTENSSYYTPTMLEGDLAILEHEYTHTQGGLEVDEKIEIGIGIEELRAEKFSKNKQGYQGVKRYFNDLYQLTGMDMASKIETRFKGGTAAEAYVDIAEATNISTMLDVVMTPPTVYLKGQSNAFMRRIYDYNGGYDGSLGRVAAAVKDWTEVEGRLATKAKIIVDIYGDRYEEYLHTCRFEGLNVVTDMIGQRIRDGVAA